MAIKYKEKKEHGTVCSICLVHLFSYCINRFIKTDKASWTYYTQYLHVARFSCIKYLQELNNSYLDLDKAFEDFNDKNLEVSIRDLYIYIYFFKYRFDILYSGAVIDIHIFVAELTNL